ncbi:recombinase family protein [Anaerotignum sp.]|uniref:recombinase family protein n=1 Tax=Anaerotignum sp. TaxID=2039241 RepID=UPI00289D661A|nr:recombinase family protein [Anaerotignum sp.]
MQTHMPIGYQMINGEIHIDEQKSKTVQCIYEDYVSGKSLLAIAKKLRENGIPNANNKTNWTHGAVGRILENTKYLGDDFYPPLINKELYDKAQVKRKQTETRLGRTIQCNSMKNQGVLANKVFCGECGEPYRKYTEHCGKPWEKVRWKCKKYIYNNRVLCKNLFFTEDELKGVFISAVGKLMSKKYLLDEPKKRQPIQKSAELQVIENRIIELEEQEQFSSKELAQLIFKRAEMTYQASKIDDYEPCTQKIKECLQDIRELTDFDEELFKAIVKKIIVYHDGKVETEFINGLRISEILEYKRKDEGDGNTKKDGGNYTTANEI